MERKGIHQKQKLLYLLKILSEETDDSHFLTMRDILKKLEDCGVNADRKTIYTDIVELRDFGFDILLEKVGRNYYYHMGDRLFELPEMKMLVDAVQSAKAITNKKSAQLIKKLETMVSKYEAKKLHRQVFIAGRIKTMNESIYYNVDAIYEAIGTDRQIRFKYFNWDIQKKQVYRIKGEWYQISPWALMWSDENYYLVAFDALDGLIKHFRVDKMMNISLTEESREGKEQFRQFDMGHYSRSLFGMFAGEETEVTMEAQNSMVSVLIDRFGKDIPIEPVDEDHFRTKAAVSVSNQFLGWILALGGKVKITGPDEVVSLMRSEIQNLAAQYGIKESE